VGRGAGGWIAQRSERENVRAKRTKKGRGPAGHGGGGRTRSRARKGLARSAHLDGVDLGVRRRDGGGDGGLDVLRGDGGPLGQVRLVPRGVAAEGPGRERVRVEGGRHGGGGATGGDGAGAAAGDGAESRGREGQSRGRERRADGHLWVARGGVVGGGGSGGIARQPVDVSQRSASLDELLSDEVCVLHSRVRISFRSRLPSASSPSTLRSLRARGRWRRSCARGGW
jgi:hypothetical protein